MDIIERMDAPGFTTYLKQYGNTICGRHPIGVFLNMIAEVRAGITNGFTMDLKFLKYAQSSQVLVVNIYLLDTKFYFPTSVILELLF